MNIWWIPLVALSLLWIMPMAGLHQNNAPVWVFLLLALFWGLMAAFVRPLYDGGTALTRHMGLSRAAALRERWKPKVLPPARVALGIMAMISAVYAAMAWLG